MEELPLLLPAYFDLVICDLPYGVTQAPWDKKLPLGELWPLLRRVLKPSGAVIMFSAFPFTGEVWESNKEEFRLHLVWSKTAATGFFQAKKRPLKAHEDMLLFSPLPSPFYAPQMEEGELYIRKRKGRSKTVLYSPTDRTDTINKGERYPTTVRHYGPPKQRGLNPTQKPLPLLSWLLRSFCPSGGAVLDPTMGSGSSGAAALSLGYSFVGIEKDPEQFKTSEQRLQKIQTKLF